jgi:hypothetical protein
MEGRDGHGGAHGRRTHVGRPPPGAPQALLKPAAPFKPSAHAVTHVEGGAEALGHAQLVGVLAEALAAGGRRRRQGSRRGGRKGGGRAMQGAERGSAPRHARPSCRRLQLPPQSGGRQRAPPGALSSPPRAPAPLRPAPRRPAPPRRRPGSAPAPPRLRPGSAPAPPRLRPGSAPAPPGAGAPAPAEAEGKLLLQVSEGVVADDAAKHAAVEGEGIAALGDGCVVKVLEVPGRFWEGGA